jgi:hypothetical protein
MMDVSIDLGCDELVESDSKLSPLVHTSRVKAKGATYVRKDPLDDNDMDVTLRISTLHSNGCSLSLVSLFLLPFLLLPPSHFSPLSFSNFSPFSSLSRSSSRPLTVSRIYDL